jgi:hypothetical protein
VLSCTVLFCLQACSAKQLDCISELCQCGARAGVCAKSSDDVELHYAACGKNWSTKLVQQVRHLLLVPRTPNGLVEVAC